MQCEPIDYPVDALPTRDDHVRTTDDWMLPVTVTSPELGAHGTVVVCSALGVPHQFYATFVRALYLVDWRVVTFDCRGISEAAATGPGTPRSADWGRHDIDTVLKWVHDTLVPEGCSGRRLVVPGHSTGGQLAGLAPHIVHADALVHVTVSLANARLWPWREPLARPQLAWLLWIRIPLAVARVCGGMLPLTAVGIGPMAIPAAILGDRARFTRRHGYPFARRAGLDTLRYPRLAVPLFAWGFDDDPMAPANAIDALIVQLPIARITRRQVNGAALGAKGVGHTGLFRASSGAPWWRETVVWLDTLAWVNTLIRHAARGPQRLHQMRWSRPLGFDAPSGERRQPAHPLNRIARVLEPCLRLNASRDRHSGGFDLGLAIVRRIALVRGGDVHLDAAAAGGARLVVLLPAMTIPSL